MFVVVIYKYISVHRPGSEMRLVVQLKHMKITNFSFEFLKLSPPMLVRARVDVGGAEYG